MGMAQAQFDQGRPGELGRRTEAAPAGVEGAGEIVYHPPDQRGGVKGAEVRTERVAGRVDSPGDRLDVEAAVDGTMLLRWRVSKEPSETVGRQRYIAGSEVRR